MELNSDEIRRYSRHLTLPEVGLEGQKKICSASVLCIGAGGLGSPIAMYLAAAGVGKLGIVDFDAVDFSNLQRQILHGTPDVGRPKTQSAQETIHRLNPGVQVVLHDTRLTSENALEVIRPYDIVVDGTDNFPTRYLTNDACVLLNKPNVYGSIFRFEGQASVFAPHLEGPCYRCLTRSRLRPAPCPVAPKEVCFKPPSSGSEHMEIHSIPHGCVHRRRFRNIEGIYSRRRRPGKRAVNLKLEWWFPWPSTMSIEPDSRPGASERRARPTQKDHKSAGEFVVG